MSDTKKSPFHGIETACANVEKWCAKENVIAGLAGNERLKDIAGVAAVTLAKLQVALLDADSTFGLIMRGLGLDAKLKRIELMLGAFDQKVPYSSDAHRVISVAADSVVAAQRIRHLISS